MASKSRFARLVRFDQATKALSGFFCQPVVTVLRTMGYEPVLVLVPVPVPVPVPW